jgi:hypothetical protein
MKIKIFDEIGFRCIVKDQGQRIYDEIHPLLLDGQTVTLDFNGVKQFASPFFNFAIGQLLKDIKKEDLDKRLIFENLIPDGRMVVERVIENASNYHADIDYQKIVDSILQQQAEDGE